MAKKLEKSFIKEVEAKLLKEKEETVIQIEELKKDDPFMDPDHASDNAAIDTDVREQLGHETIQAEVRDLQRRTKDIDLALRKIKSGEYGYCERCALQIPLQRLKVIPEARYCMECESKLVR